MKPDEAEDVDAIEKVLREKTESLGAEAEDGDAYNEDFGDFLGTLDPIVHPETSSITLEIAVLHKGEFYVYKLDRKYKKED